MSVRRDVTARKNEILDAAADLFTTKGYDKTTTADLLKRAGIARGTLYYHFTSKEEVLDALVNRIVDGLLSRVRRAVSEDAPTLVQLLSFIQAMKVDSPIGAELGNQVHKPENALLHQKMQDRLLGGVIPLAAELFRKGIERGDVKTKYPDQAAEMLILYSSLAFDDLSDLDAEGRQEKVLAFLYNMERLLGLDEGDLASLAQHLQ